jgi:preprotein translocase subunit SecD
MHSIRNRLIFIGALVALSIFYLFPREQTIRERGEDGVMRDVQVTRVPLKRGLDLQGGMHLELELDQSRRVSADPAGDIEKALTVLRKRIDEFGVSEPLIQKSGDSRIVVELAGISDPVRAMAIVQRSAFLEFRITDKTGALERSLPSLDRILRGLGVQGGTAPAAPTAVQQLLGDSVTRDTTAAASGPAILAGLIQPAAGADVTPTPGEYMVPEAAYPRVDSMLNLPQVQRALPRNVSLRWSSQPTSVGVESYRFLYALEDKPIITGESLVDAQAQFDPLTNGAIVVFELNRTGARQFGAETGSHVGDFMAIILDDLVQGRPPVIQSRIDRRGQITLGNKTLQEAQDLALTLRAGALPVPLKIVARHQVGASLGRDSIRQGITAGVVGTLLVILIMLGYYRFAGVLAVGALGLYVLFTLGGLSMVGATLTLPGLAGLVLSIGIAVDANVLIFERIREELQHGKTVRLAVDEGFKHAMNAIIDSNVSTVLTALFLFQFGTGPVKGFAVTLIMGIAASMITAVFVTRTFFMIWLQRRPALTTLSI